MDLPPRALHEINFVDRHGATKHAERTTTLTHVEQLELWVVLAVERHDSRYMYVREC